MSAMAMLLTAALAVPADAPEKVSMDMVLDLSGEWEGTAQNTNAKSRVKISRGQLDSESERGRVGSNIRIIDEGEGKLRIELNVAGAERNLLGIYKWQGSRLLICCREKSKGRPRSFMVDEVTSSLILHRVKSRM